MPRHQIHRIIIMSNCPQCPISIVGNILWAYAISFTSKGIPLHIRVMHWEVLWIALDWVIFVAGTCIISLPFTSWSSTWSTVGIIGEVEFSFIFWLFDTSFSINSRERNITLLCVENEQWDLPLFSILVPICFLTQLVEFILAKHDLDKFVTKLHVFLLKANNVKQFLLLRRKLLCTVFNFKLGCFIAFSKFLDHWSEFCELLFLVASWFLLRVFYQEHLFFLLFMLLKFLLLLHSLFFQLQILLSFYLKRLSMLQVFWLYLICWYF